MTDQEKAEIIIDEVCDYLKVQPVEIKRADRRRELVEARHFSMRYIRKYTSMSLSSIGELFRKDHCSVMHGIKNAGALIDWNGYSGADIVMRSRIENKLDGVSLKWCEKICQY